MYVRVCVCVCVSMPVSGSTMEKRLEESVPFLLLPSFWPSLDLMVHNNNKGEPFSNPPLYLSTYLPIYR